MSILSRGSVEEKLRWTFSLYDINGDGFITREEMTDIVTAVYELVGRHPETAGPDVEKIKEKVDKIFMVSVFAKLHFNSKIESIKVFLMRNSTDLVRIISKLVRQAVKKRKNINRNEKISSCIMPAFGHRSAFQVFFFLSFSMPFTITIQFLIPLMRNDFPCGNGIFN